MKQAFIRLLAYFAVITLFYQILGVGEPIPTGKSAGFYVGYFGVTYGFWMVLFEVVYRLLRWNTNRQRDNANTPTGNSKHLFPNNQMGQHTQSLNCWCHPEQVDGFVFHRNPTAIMQEVYSTRPVDRPIE